MNRIEILINSSKSVFTVQDLAVLWSLAKDRKLYESIKYYVRNGKLISLRRGLHALPQDIREYSILELAQKLIPLSYISLETALGQYGISFQFVSCIKSIALISKKITVRNQIFQYHQVKSSVLYNNLGLITNKECTIAGPERAVCDSLYIYPNITFDNLRNVDFEKLKEISQLYANTSLENRIKQLMRKREAR
jgi:hypothetical protein